MAKINRYDGNLVPFAINATGTNRTIFGSVSQSDELTANIDDGSWKLGWEIVGPSDKPTVEDFSGATFTNAQLSAYLHQMGVAEWNDKQEYQIGSIANRDGIIYSCKTADHVSATSPESDPTNWLKKGSIKTHYITSSDPAWTPSYGVKSISFQIIGGGGAGGNAQAAAAGTALSAGGGGAGGTTFLFRSDISASYNIVVGAGGAASAAPDGDGLSGGDSSVSFDASTATANGGSGGIGGIALAGYIIRIGGAEGHGNGGSFSIKGGSGTTGIANAGNVVQLSSGGSSSLGGGVSTLSQAVNGRSQPETPGTGGSGATATDATGNKVGGAGSSGVVIITEYF